MPTQPRGPKEPTPRVPIQTPMFNEAETQAFTWSRTWVIFFEKLWRGQGEKGITGPYHRTVLLKDTTVGNDIADHVTVWGKDLPMTITRVVGVLRKAITSDLTLRVKINGATLGSFTIPHATAIDTPIIFTSFSGSTAVTLDQVFSWDVTASDGKVESAGVASFSVFWEPS